MAGLARIRPTGRRPAADGAEAGLISRADVGPADAGVDVGLAVRIRPRASELAVTVAVATPDGERRADALDVLAGDMGRHQAALLAAAVLFATLSRRPLRPLGIPWGVGVARPTLRCYRREVPASGRRGR